jgi:YVTN family beta-propeller protein
MSERRSTSILTTLLFIDVVSSTEIAEEMGNRRWRELLSRYHTLVRKEIARFRGREVDTAGDGFFATFGSPADALRCAGSVVEAVQHLGIEIRGGVHTGDVELAGGKVSGLAVHIAARVMAAAGPAEIMVTRTVRELATGAGFEFEELGERSLKGVAGTWLLFSVKSVESTPLAPPVAPEAARLARVTIQPAPLASRRRLVIGALLVLGLGMGVAVFAFSMSVKEKPTPPPATPTPVSLAHSDRMARISQAGSAANLAKVGLVKVGSDPAAVAVGEGSVWIANEGDDTVSRIDPVTDKAVVIGVNRRPFAIAVGEGSVWVVDRLSRTVSRIDPGTNKVIAEIDLTGGALPSTIAVGEGAVWVGVDGTYPFGIDPPAVHKIDPQSDRDVASIPISNEVAWVVLATGDGAVWAAGNGGSLVRIDPRTNALATVADLGKPPGAMVMVGDRLWVATTLGEVLEVDPATGHVDAQVPGGGSPGGLEGTGSIDSLLSISASDGVIWVTSKVDGSIDRIVADGANAIGPIMVGQTPTGVAAGFGGIWVTVDTVDASLGS